MKIRRVILLLICTLSVELLCSQYSNADKAAYQLGMKHAINSRLDKQIESLMYKYCTLLQSVKGMYVDSVDIDKFTDDAINNALKELDPHSIYIPKAEVEEMNEGIEGNFVGIGVAYNIYNDTVVINQTISGTPAERAGILPGDKIISIDGVRVAGVKIKRSKIPTMIKGEKDTKVHLGIQRESKKDTLAFTIKRDKIPIYSIDLSTIVEPGVGYIKVNSFSMTTTDEMNKALDKLESEGGFNTLILDLQGNGGGIMKAAINMVNLFLEPNLTIVSSKGTHYPEQYIRSSNYGKKLTDKNLIILIDEYSASASEITAGALQDWDRATIIGRRSFGKGLIQNRTTLYDGSELRLTIARYFTPCGRSIQKPYDKGADNYFHDLENRFKRGEFMHSDSITFPDSLKYKTLKKGKTIYGGGGIFPDIFVPLDTNKYTTYHKALLRKGIINKEVSAYIGKNRKKLTSEYKSFEYYKAHFTAPTDLLEKIKSASKEEKIQFTEKEFTNSTEKISLQIKAIIGQTLFSTKAYYEIMLPENDALQRALYYIKEGK